MAIKIPQILHHNAEYCYENKCYFNRSRYFGGSFWSI